MTTAHTRGAYERLARGARIAALAVLAAGALGACSTPRDAGEPVKPPTAPTASVTGEREWWRVRIRMGFEDVSQVDWHIDALLADQLFAPLIDRFGPAVAPWRFHRRAAPDASGHQFSFIFYADPAVAGHVVKTLESSLLLERLTRSGFVKAILMPSEEVRWGPDMGATSDRSWPSEIKRSWPWFIMGVSQHWLALVREVRTIDSDVASGDVDAMASSYLDIHQRVDALWQTHAQHAYLHHLNAAFAYRLLLLEERRLTRF